MIKIDAKMENKMNKKIEENEKKIKMALGALEGIYCDKIRHGDENFYKHLKEIIEELNK